MIEQRPKTDAELAELDVAAMLRHGLADIDGSAGQALFGEGAVAEEVSDDIDGDRQMARWWDAGRDPGHATSNRRGS